MEGLLSTRPTPSSFRVKKLTPNFFLPPTKNSVGQYLAPGLPQALESANLKELITNVGSGVGAAPAAGKSFFLIMSSVMYANFLMA